MKQDILHLEFKRQLDNLLDNGYPEAANLSREKFKAIVEPLIMKVDSATYDIDYEKGTLPFVIVVSNKFVSTEFAMTHASKDGKDGIIKLYPHEPRNFSPIKDVPIPKQNVYMCLNIDRGKLNINLPPNEAFDLIAKDSRFPLTIDEGVAIITHYPKFLMKNNCFSLLASRCKGNKRVPAIWLNSKKQPNLGWCWDGNPHTWLGSASCSQRLY